MEEPDVRQGGGCEWISMPFVLDLTLRKPPADGTIRAQATDIAADLGRADRPGRPEALKPYGPWR